MRLQLLFLLLLLVLTSFAQPVVSEKLRPNGGSFFPGIIIPACTDGLPTAMSFLGFDATCEHLVMRQIRVVAPELDGIINTEQNPALLRQPKAYQSARFSYEPWQPYASLFSDSYVLKFNFQKQFKPGGASWGMGYENYSLSSGLLEKDFPVMNDFSTRNQLTYLSYAQPLSTHWTLGLNAKYVSQKEPKSDNFTTVKTNDILAADLGLHYRKRKRFAANQELAWQWGVSLTNLGPKVQDNITLSTKKPIPTTLSMGFLVEEHIQFRNRSSLRFSGTYQFNKLLVPSACINCDDNGNDILDYLEYSAVGGMLASFNDAPGGFGEELQEINHQFEMSARYSFSEKTAISVETSLFHQSPKKGNLQIMTTRLGFHLGRLQLELSRWSPSMQLLNERSSSLGFSLGYQQFIGE